MRAAGRLKLFMLSVSNSFSHLDRASNTCARRKESATITFSTKPALTLMAVVSDLAGSALLNEVQLLQKLAVRRTLAQ